MEGNTSQALLSEASVLVTATRLRIARSMTLLTRGALEKVRSPRSDNAAVSVVARKQLHPSSVPPL
jgi:hypothetical protein